MVISCNNKSLRYACYTSHNVAVYYIADLTYTEQRAGTHTCCSGAEEAGFKVPSLEEYHFTSEAAESRIP
jgi:hypothetical protein